MAKKGINKRGDLPHVCRTLPHICRTAHVLEWKAQLVKGPIYLRRKVLFVAQNMTNKETLLLSAPLRPARPI
jgi:hypothetical protein